MKDFPRGSSVLIWRGADLPPTLAGWGRYVPAPPPFKAWEPLPGVVAVPDGTDAHPQAWLRCWVVLTPDRSRFVVVFRRDRPDQPEDSIEVYFAPPGSQGQAARLWPRAHPRKGEQHGWGK